SLPTASWCTTRSSRTQTSFSSCIGRTCTNASPPEPARQTSSSPNTAMARPGLWRSASRAITAASPTCPTDVCRDVGSTTLDNADAWQNSVLLRGEATQTVAELTAQDGNDLGIVGSVSLVRSPHAAGL